MRAGAAGASLTLETSGRHTRAVEGSDAPAAGPHRRKDCESGDIVGATLGCPTTLRPGDLVGVAATARTLFAVEPLQHARRPAWGGRAGKARLILRRERSTIC